MSVILNSLRRNAAHAVFDSIVTKSSRMYFYFSQLSAFDSDTPIEGDTLDYENKTRNNIFAMKEVLPADASFVIPRINYQSGSLYAAYNTRTSVGDYVYNSSNFSIYICIKAGTSVSTVQPSHSTIEPVTEADGYTWRFIYTIPLALRDRFLTAEWIPVSNMLTESFFSNGGIESVSIIDGGDGYQPGTTSLVVTGSSNKGHGALLEPIIDNGKIVSVVIHDPGYGYISPVVSVTSPTSTRTAVISATLSKGDIRSSQALVQTLAIPGTVESIELLTPGLGYTSAVSVSIVGDGTGANATISRNTTTGAITSVSVSNIGQDYTWAKVVISDTPVIGGSGATAHVNLSPILGFGRNPIKDLKASKLMVYHNLSREKLNGVSLENQIRQYGIIAGPKTIDNSSYPRMQVSKTNFVTTIPFDQATVFTVGTHIYNEFPVTASSQEFVVEEQIIGQTVAGIRVRAITVDAQLQSGARYYKNSNDNFLADYGSSSISVDRQFVSACYVLKTTSPAFFDINTFTVGTTLYKSGKRFVIAGTSSTVILVTSIDGGVLATGDTLTDNSANTLIPQTIEDPVFDKKSGDIITIVKPANPITYGQSQSVSFRTIIDF